MELGIRLQARTAIGGDLCAVDVAGRVRDQKGDKFRDFVCLADAAQRDVLGEEARAEEIIALAKEKDAPFFKAVGSAWLGVSFALAGNPAEAAELIAPSVARYRATGAKIAVPHILSHLAGAHAQLGQFDGARRCIGEAMATEEESGERWFSAETQRIAGEIERMSTERDAMKAQAYFERALEIARVQLPGHGNSARQRASHGCGAIRVSGHRPMTFSRRSTTGSLRASTRST